MAMNITRAPSALKKDGSEGRILANQIYVGVVKDNADAQRMGRLRVWIPEFGGEPGNEASWITVSYASPFAGVSNPAQLAGPDDGGDEHRKMSGTQTSYGWWAVPPDVENHVLICFASGDLARGFYFACLYQHNMNHMVPGIPLNKSTDATLNETVLPVVCEYNKKDTGIQDLKDPERPVYEPLHNGLTEQGLYTDPERGASITGARRMDDRSLAPVYGLLTPGGNTIHIDEDPQNEFIRLRTKSGVQVLIHETTGYIYMNSKLGNSWMEISDEGINLYSKYDISLRAEGSINMHADNSVATQGGAVHTRGGNVTTHAEGQHSTVSGGNTVRQGGNILDNPANADGSPQYASTGDSATSGGGETGGGETGGGESVDGGTPSSKGFVAPVEGVGGSQFGMRRHPVTGQYKMHEGIDIKGMATGTPVVAASGGTVVSAGRAGGYGNLVVIDHGNGVTTRYGHLNGINVSPGQTVAAGQRIGGAGSTGVSTGTHLHYEVRENGRPVDPNTYHDNAFQRGNRITRGIDPLFRSSVSDGLRPVDEDELALLLRYGRSVASPAAGDLVVLRDKTLALFRERVAGRFLIEPVDGAGERSVTANAIMAFRRVPMALGPWLDLLRDAEEPCPCCQPVRTRGDTDTGVDAETTASYRAQDAEAAAKLNAKTPPETTAKQDVSGSGGSYSFTSTSTIASVLPTHEPWYGHPVPVKPFRSGTDPAGGTSNGGASAGGGAGGGGGSYNGPIPPAGSMSAAGDIPVEGRALLDTIAQAEGGDYTIGYGRRSFSDLSWHPYRKGQFPSGDGKTTTSAAGRYQFVRGTWDEVAGKLGLTDFSPASQDKAAWYKAQQKYKINGGGDLLTALRDGSFQPSKLGNEWASFPGGSGPGGGRYSSEQIDAMLARNMERQNAAGSGAPERGDPGDATTTAAATTPTAGTPPGTPPVSTTPTRT